MPSTTGYILISANSEYGSIDTTLVKAGSFEEVYSAFIKLVMPHHSNWFSGLSRDNLPVDMRNTFEEKENEMLKYLHETPLADIKKIMDPLTPPIGATNAEQEIWTSFSGWDWDWNVGFTFRVRGPYLQAMINNKVLLKPPRDGEEIDFYDFKGPICSYWAEDTTDEYYGTNISLIKL